MGLIEALFAIAIFSLGILGFTELFTRSWQNNRYIFEMGQASFAVSQAMNKTVDYIRRARQGDDGSFAVRSAGDNDIVFFCDYDKDNVTERLHIYKSGTSIRLGITEPTATLPRTYPASDQTTQIIAENIVNSASTPIFYYYNRNYPGDTVNNPVNTPAAVADVRLMKMYLEINIDPNRAPDNIKLESFVELRNLNDYDRIQ